MSAKPDNFTEKTAPARHRGRFSGGVRRRRYLDLVFHTRDEAFAAPKLNCAFIDEVSGLVDGFVVVNANQRLKPLEVTIGPNGICSVIGHGRGSSDWHDCRLLVFAVRAKVGSNDNARVLLFDPGLRSTAYRILSMVVAV